MFEINVSKTQLSQLNAELQLTERELLNISTRTFKASAKDFAKNVIKRAGNEQKISTKKLRQRIKQFVINDLKIKIFSGLFRIGLTNWRARQIGKVKKGGKYRKSGRNGVEYGAPGARKFRQGAFIMNAKKKDGSPGGKIAFKRTGKERLPIQKQVDDIDKAIEPILENESKNFYEIFEKAFDRECGKYLRTQLKRQGITG